MPGVVAADSHISPVPGSHNQHCRACAFLPLAPHVLLLPLLPQGDDGVYDPDLGRTLQPWKATQVDIVRDALVRYGMDCLDKVVAQVGWLLLGLGGVLLLRVRG